ncbi:MAG TPA: hypothetical protein VJ740_01480, partial [Hyphomicrobiaceae bacterium]|nr:hypothetical protein [Hyphomicrobiaceae bacterium]
PFGVIQENEMAAPELQFSFSVFLLYHRPGIATWHDACVFECRRATAAPLWLRAIAGVGDQKLAERDLA